MGTGAKVRTVFFALAVVAGCGTDKPSGPTGGASSEAGAPASGGESSKPMGGATNVGAAAGEGGKPGGATNVGAAAGEGGKPGEPMGGEAGQAGSDVSGCSSGIYKDELSETQPPDLPCGALGNLQASSGVVFNFGLTRPVTWLKRTDNRLLGADGDGNWALWNPNDKTLLASGQIRSSSCQCVYPDLAGDLFTLLAPDRLEVRSLIDGSLLNAITIPADPQHQGGLALDGSYYWSGTTERITAWDTNGNELATKSGNYSKGSAQVSAAPGELRIANGPAGDRVIERISIDTGKPTTSPFLGNFVTWFLDGGRFLTAANTTIRVYSADTGTEEKTFSLPYFSALAGHGDYFWSAGYWDGEPRQLAIFSLADPSAPLAVYPYSTAPTPVGNRIVMTDPAQLDVIELDPAGLKRSSVSRPSVPGPWLFTVDAAGNWAFGNEQGLVFDGTDTERPLSCGTTYAIAGSKQGTIALSTSVGILLFELSADSRAYLGSIPFPSYDLDLSSDGSVLAAVSLHALRLNQDDTAFQIWSLPDRSELRAVSSPPTFYDVSFSALGNRLASFSSGGLQVADLAGNVTFEQRVSEKTKLVLSPDGSRLAVQRRSLMDIYDNGTVIESFTAVPLLWIDQDHLLMDAPSATIYQIPGGVQPGPNLPELRDENLRLISSTEVYAERSNRVLSLSTGEELWSCETTAHGAVAANNIVFVPQRSSNKLVVVPYSTSH